MNDLEWMTYPATWVWWRCYGSIPGDLKHAWN